MQNKLISIIIPVKNGSNYIGEAIDGITKQNMNVEIIIIDDASTDNTAKIAEQLGCVVIKHNTCKGQVAGKNTGIKAAKGDYIMFHDHDDIMNDSALKIMYEVLENNSSIAAVMAKIQDFISPDLGKNCGIQPKADPYWGLFTGAVLIRKNVFDVIGLFDENLTAGEIITFQGRLEQNCLKMNKISNVSTNRRLHGTNFGRINKSQEYKDYAYILRCRVRNESNSSNTQFISAMTNMFRSNAFIQDRRKISDEEHNGNVLKLLSDLITKAFNHANNLVVKLEKTYNKNFVSVKDIYTQAELEQLEKVKKFENSIVKANDCYMYEKYKLPVKLFESCVFYYKYGIDTLQSKSKLDNNHAIIDVGGHIGDSILIFREKFKHNPIHSFEPAHENFIASQKTIQMNNIENVKIINKGLGERNERLKITAHDSLLKSCENYISENGTEEINVITFDTYVKEHNLEVGLIKVDIEGHEQQFLNGAKETISTQRPILLISIYHNYDDFYKIKPLIESWNLGYEFDFFQGIQNSGHIAVETILIAEPI